MAVKAGDAPKATELAKPRGLLHAKWLLIGKALSDPGLSAADCAVLWQLCERYNEEAGAAWPSMTLLASDTGRNRKTVQRSLARLQAAALVLVTERGTRARSNRYRPALAKVGAQTPIGRGVDDPYVGARTPPESTYSPVNKPESRGRPSPASAGSGGGAGASPPPPSGRQFPQFWQEFPKATQVFRAEQLIGELVSSGVTLPELVRGAKAYAQWVRLQPWADRDKYIAGPVGWLEKRRWLDDYKIKRTRGQADKAEAKPATGKHASDKLDQAATVPLDRRPTIHPQHRRPSAQDPATRAEIRELRVRVLEMDNPQLRARLGEIITPQWTERWLAMNPGNIPTRFSDQQVERIKDALSAERARGSGR